LAEALDICRASGYGGNGLTEVLNETGALHRARGDLGQAGDCHREALDIAKKSGSIRDEACALAGLGRCALAAGRTADAITALRQAQEIFQRIGAAEAPDLFAELDALTGPP
jgi:Flp pilus assembly protein TadD